jgi:hypothetical protein
MAMPILIGLDNVREAEVAIAAVEAYRSQGPLAPRGSATATEPDGLEDRIYAALRTSTFTKPSQTAARVLLAANPSEPVSVTAVTNAFMDEGLASTEPQAWHRVRAAFATLSWLMDQRLTSQDKAGAAKPIDVFATRSLDQKGRRMYRLTRAGRAAAQRFFDQN